MRNPYSKEQLIQGKIKLSGKIFFSDLHETKIEIRWENYMLQMNETYPLVFVYPFSDIQHQGMEEKYCKSFYIMDMPFFTLRQSILNVQYDSKSR